MAKNNQLTPEQKAWLEKVGALSLERLRLARKATTQDIEQVGFQLSGETGKVVSLGVYYRCPVCGCRGELWVIDSPRQKQKLFQACCSRNPWHKGNLGYKRCSMTPIPDPPIADSVAVVRAWRLASQLSR